MSLNLGIIASSRTTASGGALLLDTYPGAAAAYSLRKLRTAYTGSCIRVRRSSDNTQTDIGFNVLGGLDTVSLLTFCGISNGFITIWYDQSGNSRNTFQTGISGNPSHASPQIVISGSLVTINGKAAVLFSTSAFYTPSFSLVSDVSYFMVQKTNVSNAQGLTIGNAKGFGALFGKWNDGKIYLQRVTNSGGFFTGVANTSLTQSLLEAFTISSTMNIYQNGSLQSSTAPASFSNTTTTFDSIGYGSSSYSNAYGQEVIVYTSNQTSNRTAIETNINSFYTIY
jgi:hypothetical protein